MYGRIVPAPPLSLIVPIGRPLSVTQSTLPLGRFTFATLTFSVTNPPQAVSFDWSASSLPLGALPPIGGPVSVALWPLGALAHCGLPGVGGGDRVKLKAWVAALPLPSVTCIVNVEPLAGKP